MVPLDVVSLYLHPKPSLEVAGIMISGVGFFQDPSIARRFRCLQHRERLDILPDVALNYF